MAGRRQVTAQEAAEIEAVIGAALASLRGAGIDARPPAFPFSLHHEHFRVKLRRRGYSPRHADVALLLEKWADGRPEGFAYSYAWQAVAGAVAKLKPTARLPADLAQGIASVSGAGSFLEWAKRTSTAGAEPQGEAGAMQAA